MLQYRYILIPGGVSTSRTTGQDIREGGAAVLGNGTVIDYAHMSYEEVCAKLGIKPYLYSKAEAEGLGAV